MPAIDHGFMGQMLWVDLTRREIKTTPLEEEAIRCWGGAAGLNTKLAFELIPARCDPLGAENHLIVGSGPFVATAVPAASRSVISAKSPQTNQYATSAPGCFGPMMKQAGYDFLIVSGKADRPVYLKILDDDVTIEEAPDLWGRDVYETTDILFERYPSCWVGAIGPAGEQLVAYAGIVFNKYSLAGSTGLGAVMGSKNLKALVARGTKSVRVADPATFMRLAHKAHVEIVSGAHVPSWRELGTLIQFQSFAAGADDDMLRAGFDMAAWTELYMQNLHRGPVSCPQCPVGCKALLAVKGKEFPVTCPAGTVALPFALHRRLPVDRAVEIAECGQLCNQLGLSTMAVSQLIGLAIRLSQQGALDEALTGGLELRPGDPAVVQHLIADIAYRRTPLGDALASRLDICLDRLGDAARQYPTRKGTLTNIDKRLSSSDDAPWDAHTFSQVVDPRGPVAENAYISLAWMPNRSEAQIRRYLSGIGVPEKDHDLIVTGGTDGYNLAKLTKWVEYYNLVLFDVGACQRSFISKALPLAVVAALYRSATGLDLGEAALLGTAERTLNLQRLFNIREGLTREVEVGDTSDLPPEEIVALNHLLDEYYAYHDWSPGGVPRVALLCRLGLDRYASAAAV